MTARGLTRLFRQPPCALERCTRMYVPFFPPLRRSCCGRCPFVSQYLPTPGPSHSLVPCSLPSQQRSFSTGMPLRCRRSPPSPPSHIPDVAPEVDALAARLKQGERRALAQAVTLVESSHPRDRRRAEALLARIAKEAARSGPTSTYRLGISGPPGVGKVHFEAFQPLSVIVG